MGVGRRERWIGGELIRLNKLFVHSLVGTHTALALQALDSGCAVLLEKPAVTSLQQWQELSHAADSAGLPLQTALHARFSPDRRWYQQASRWLIAEHGPVCAVHSQAFDPYIHQGNVSVRSASLAGSWLDSGINALSGIDMLLESWSVESVRQIASHNIADTAAVATLRFSRRGIPDAGMGTIETSWHAKISWKQTTLSFEETGARLHLEHSRHRAVLCAPEQAPAELFSAPMTRRRLYTHYDGVYRDFLQVLMGRKDNRALSSRLHHALLKPLEHLCSD